MNLETLSTFTLGQMLSDCAEGSATQRQIQKELRSRWENMKHADNETLGLFSNEELKATRKK